MSFLLSLFLFFFNGIHQIVVIGEKKPSWHEQKAMVEREGTTTAPIRAAAKFPPLPGGVQGTGSPPMVASRGPCHLQGQPLHGDHHLGFVAAFVPLTESPPQSTGCVAGTNMPYQWLLCVPPPGHPPGPCRQSHGAIPFRGFLVV